jgi:hypothetical protein
MEVIGGPPLELLVYAKKEQLNRAGYHQHTLISECLAREQVEPDFHYRRVA